MVVGVQTADGKFHDLKASHEYGNIIDRNFPVGFIVPKVQVDMEINFPRA